MCALIKQPSDITMDNAGYHTIPYLSKAKRALFGTHSFSKLKKQQYIDYLKLKGKTNLTSNHNTLYHHSQEYFNVG